MNLGAKEICGSFALHQAILKISLFIGVVVTAETNAIAMPLPSSGAAGFEKAPDPDGALLIPDRPKPSKKNYLPRVWSIGGRVGSYGNTGLHGQYVGDGEVAWNVGINVLNSGGDMGFGFTLERLMLFDDSFDELTWKNLQKWYDSRGRLVYYTGIGMQLDSLGFYPRIPFGVQFTMTADPIAFFGQVTVAYGPLINSGSGSGLTFAPEFGARYVLDP